MKEQKLEKWDPVQASWENPFGLLRRVTSDMERLFEDFPGGRMQPRGSRLGEAKWIPSIDVFEKDGALMVRADLPGLKKEDVKIDVTEDAITLQGERKKETEEEKEGMYRFERAYGSFYRSVPMPEGAKPEDVKAAFQNGVLEITVPLPAKKEAARSRRVEIQDAAGERKSSKPAA